MRTLSKLLGQEKEDTYERQYFYNSIHINLLDKGKKQKMRIIGCQGLG